jgi:hypothetical protein
MPKRLLIVMFVVLLLLPVGAAFAYPFCGPDQPPNQPSGFCRYDLTGNDTYRVAPGVPFVWLRTEPSSHAAIRATIWPSAGASMVTVGGVARWDGVQWWYEVRTYPSGHVTGWVERVSLAQVVLNSPPVLTPTPTPFPAPPPDGVSDPSIEIQADWRPPFNARVEAGVPFLWMREAPNAGRIIFTLPRNGAFRVIGPAAYDGRQWWWQVSFGIGTTQYVGWVEQGSITPTG